MKKVRYSFLVTCVFAALVSSCDYPIASLDTGSNIYTSKQFNVKAMVPASDCEPGSLVLFEKHEMGDHFGLYCDNASCNRTPAVMLELNHEETGDPDHLEIKGEVWITLDHENLLYGTYVGSGVRIPECLCEFSGYITNKMGTGMFNIEATSLNLYIKGISQRGNPEPGAYEVVIDGCLRNPGAIL